MFFCESLLYYSHVIIMDTMACISDVCIITNFMLNVWWRFLTVNLQYTCYFLDLFQTWTISCQISFYFIQLLLITIIYIKMYSVTLTRVVRIFPLHVRLVKTMSGFYVCVLHWNLIVKVFYPIGLWYCYQLGRRTASCKEMWGMWVNYIVFLVLVNYAL